MKAANWTIGWGENMRDKPIFEKIPEQYIVLANFEFGWTKAEIEQLREMWKANKSLEEIVYTLRPTEKGSFEVVLAIIDQLYKGNIKPRKKAIIIGG